MRLIHVLRSLGLLLVLGSNSPLHSQHTTRQLDSLFTELHQHDKFNGNVLVAQKGQLIFAKSYGKADEQQERALNIQSVFELASVSKQFTAMGIVLLKKQQKLDYDDALADYIPELAFYRGVTIRQLLNHTAGLPDYMDLFEAEWNKHRFATNDDLIAEFARFKPAALFAPGEKYTYSNTGYALLASVIERVTKQSYGDFLASHIFTPLEMTHSRVYRSRYQPQHIANYALGYVSDSLGRKVHPDVFGPTYYTHYLDGVVGDGMVNSTVGDLLLWDQALYTDKLINDTDRQAIFSGATLASGARTDYGFGWSLLDSKPYGRIVNHTGGWAGYISLIERHLDTGMTIIMLQNNATDRIQIPLKVVRKILYHEPLVTEGLKPVSTSAQSLEKYVGLYSASTIPLKLAVFIRDNSLWAQGQAAGQRPFRLDAYEHHTFKYEAASIRMVFDPEKRTLSFEQGDKVSHIFAKEQ